MIKKLTKEKMSAVVESQLRYQLRKQFRQARTDLQRREAVVKFARLQAGEALVPPLANAAMA